MTFLKLTVPELAKVSPGSQAGIINTGGMPISVSGAISAVVLPGQRLAAVAEEKGWRHEVDWED